MWLLGNESAVLAVSPPYRPPWVHPRGLSASPGAGAILLPGLDATNVKGTVPSIDPLFWMRARFNRTLTNAGSWLSRPEPVVAVGVFTVLWVIVDSEFFQLAGSCKHRNAVDDALHPTLGTSGHAGYSRQT